MEEGGEGERLQLNLMPMILILMQLLERTLTLFWRMDKKSTMISFQHTRTKKLIEVILNAQYINMDRIGIVYNKIG